MTVLSQGVPSKTPTKIALSHIPTITFRTNVSSLDLLCSATHFANQCVTHSQVSWAIHCLDFSQPSRGLYPTNLTTRRVRTFQHVTGCYTRIKGATYAPVTPGLLWVPKFNPTEDCQSRTLTPSQFSFGVHTSYTGCLIATCQEGPLTTKRLANSLNQEVQGTVGHSASTFWPGIIRRTRYFGIAREQAPGCVSPADVPTHLAQHVSTN